MVKIAIFGVNLIGWDDSTGRGQLLQPGEVSL